MPTLDLVTFGALAASHNRLQEERMRRTDQSLFYNTRMAFHADKKAAKKWSKQWSTGQTEERDAKASAMRLKRFVPAPE